MSRHLVVGSLLALAGMVAVSCSDSTPSETVTSPGETSAVTESPTPSPTETDAPSPTPLFRGITEDTIELGIASVDFDELLSLGFIDFNHGDEEVIWQALLDDINDRGGIHDRKLTAIFDAYLPVGNTEAEKSCLFFTEDNEVFAVLGLWIGDSVLCLTETHETIHVGQLMRQEWIDRSIAPLVTPAIAQERELLALLAVLSETGRLDDKTVGVLTQVANESSVDTVVRPYFQDRGLDLATVGVIPDLGGDRVAVDAEVQGFTERWRVDGVDFLLVVGTSGILSIADIRTALGPIDVAVGDAETFQQIFGAVPDSDRGGFEGILTLAGLSATNGEQINEPLLRECVQTVEAAVPGLVVVDSGDLTEPEDWFAGIRDACTSLAVFVAAATAAGPDLTNESFRTGVESLGSIQLPGQAFASFGPGKFDGEDGFRLVEFDPHDGDEGSFSALTEIVDTAG